MLQKDSLIYRLFPSRGVHNHDDLHTLLTLLKIPFSTCSGFIQLLYMKITSAADIPSELFHLSRRGTDLRGNFAQILEGFATIPRSEITCETISSLRHDTLGFLLEIRQLLIQLYTYQILIESIFENSDYFFERLKKTCDEIEDLVDVMTNPELRIPPYITLWLKVRDEVREKAAKGERQVLPLLLQAAANPLMDIRHEAATALGHYKDETAVSCLIALLQDEEGEVRGEAAYSLRRIQDRRAIEPLIQSLEQNKDYRGWIAEALAAMPDPRALPSLIKVLKEEMSEPYSGEVLFYPIAGIKKAIEAIGGKEAEAVLQHYFSSR